MTQQRTLLFAENFTTHQEFRLRETTIRGMSIKIFLIFFLLIYVHMCIYTYVLFVKDPPSLTQSCGICGI